MAPHRRIAVRLLVPIRRSQNFQEGKTTCGVKRTNRQGERTLPLLVLDTQLMFEKRKAALSQSRNCGCNLGGDLFTRYCWLCKLYGQVETCPYYRSFGSLIMLMMIIVIIIITTMIMVIVIVRLARSSFPH